MSYIRFAYRPELIRRHAAGGQLKKLAALGILLGGTASFMGAHALEVLPKPIPEFAGKVDPDRLKAVPDKPKLVKAKAGSPNIVIVLLDDNGFASNSTFGGPSDTPELTKLAAGGLTYNSFAVSPMSSPTRAALLSGRDPHRIGWGVVPEEAAGYPGYNTIWPRSAASVAEVLKGNGYSTAAFGKWHNTPFNETTSVGPFERWPTGLGFEYFYGFNSGYDSQFEPRLFRNTTPVEPPAKVSEGYHMTTDLVDDAVRWVHQHDAIAPEKPFFMYFAPAAVHWPHHAPKELIAKYKGKFDQGWDALRVEVFERQKKLGIIPANAELTPRDSRMPAWDSLTPEQKALTARQMEVYAAFLEQTDREVGRLINTLRAEGHVEDTVIFYLSGDNGAATTHKAMLGKDLYSVDGNIAPVAERLQRMDDLGSEKFDNIYATPWAWAGSTPFKGTKQMASYLGGTRNALVVSWPGHNLADKNPAKLKEMIALFDKEAKRTHVYPVQPLEEPLAPPADGKKKHYVFRSGVTDVPKINGPWVGGRNHTISADVEVASSGAKGVIIADGGRFGGFTLFVDKEGKVTYEANVFGRQSGKVTSEQPLTPGRHNISVTYIPDATNKKGPPFPGSIQMSIDGHTVGEGKLTHLMVHYTGALSVGKDSISPISQEYEAPYAFTGNIDKVEVNIK